MITNVNLPCVIHFYDEMSVENFCFTLGKIIPKVKFERVNEGNWILYTRKDKNYRAIMESALTENTTETPAPAADETDGMSAEVNAVAQGNVS